MYFELIDSDKNVITLHLSALSSNRFILLSFLFLNIHRNQIDYRQYSGGWGGGGGGKVGGVNTVKKHLKT